MSTTIPQNGQFCATQNSTDGIPIVVNDRTCGFVMPGGTYYKRIKGSVHIIRKFHAIGFGLDVLAIIEQMSVDRIRVVDADTGIEYLATLATLRSEGIEFNDRLFGKQLALRCDKFAQRLPSGALVQPKTARAEPEQLAMFGGA